MIEVAEAKRVLFETVRPLETFEADLAAALGHTLAEVVDADRDVPPADTSTMDGFALRSADVPQPGTAVRVVGEIRAGQSPSGIRVGPGEAVRILTGALVPDGADSVVMVELTRADEPGTVRILERPERGQNIRRHGEDARRGETILAAGTPVHAAEVAVLAAFGKTKVRVVGKPVVHVVSTGDEVIDARAVPQPHQVRNSNAYALLAQLAEMGIRGTDLGIAPDEPAALERLLEQGLAGDLLLVTGGVSEGAYDLVGQALARFGVRRLFHKVAVRPGKPLLAAIRDRCLVLGLPGNPVSTFTTFAVFAAPTIRKMQGVPRFDSLEMRAVLAAKLRARPGRTTYHLARLEMDDGRLRARPARTMGSGDVVSLSRANGFVITAADARSLDEGSEVSVVPWPDFQFR